LACLKLAIHLYAGRNYGYFVDELYYIACSKHLDWGYVDQPPLIALIVNFVRATLGESLIALRFLPALAGAALVLMTGWITRDLGGGRFAQGLAALCVLASPGFFSMQSFVSMNAFEPLFWTGCAWLLIRLIRTGDQTLWLPIGILAGIGLENKYSMAIFGSGLLLGILLTPDRRALRKPWIWLGLLAALLVFLPNLMWNIQHRFPFLELQANISRNGRNVALSPLSFFLQEVLSMLPLIAPVWLAGLWFYFRTPAGKPFRALGWAWIFTAAVITLLNPRIYYLFPAFPVLFAGGSIALEQWLDRPRLAWARVAFPAAIVVLGVVLAPLAVPVLPVDTYIRYSRFLQLQPPAIENHRLGPLPQLYADQFGWDEMAMAVARVYNALPPETRARTAIFGQNYGQAGAIDFFGPKYGLPPALSAHQNYFFWGPRDYTGESMIILDDRKEVLDKIFDEVRLVAHVEHPYSMPYQHFDVFYCRGMKPPLPELWPRLKRWN
jgi:hypothetical protein